MSGLTRLSDTRWHYATGRRTYYIRQVVAPNDDCQEDGLYLVDDGSDNVRLVASYSVERIAGELCHYDPFAALGPG
jgi:hypothetical protein